MAKSIRSKVKRVFRAKKREDGVYAATHAARLQRLHARIDAIAAAPKPVHDEILEDAEDIGGDEEVQQEEEIVGECQSWMPTSLCQCFLRIRLNDTYVLLPIGKPQPKASGSGTRFLTSRRCSDLNEHIQIPWMLTRPQNLLKSTPTALVIHVAKSGGNQKACLPGQRGRV